MKLTLHHINLATENVARMDAFYQDVLGLSDQVAGLVKEMQDAEVDLTLVSFPGVLHSFTNPGADKIAEEFGMPVGYDEEAASRSWDGTMRFYKAIFTQ